MKFYYQAKRQLKLIRLDLRRARAAKRWGKDVLNRSPMIFGNAIPKAGSHLLIQVLLGLTEIGPFVDPGFPPINRFEGNTRLELPERIEELKHMRPGDIRYGYAGCKEPLLSVITEPSRASVFIYRDPRDQLVSHVFYAKDIHTGHGMHDYYNNVLTTMEERLNVAIEGCELPGLGLPTIWKRYEEHFGWFERDDVYCVKFEDFILNKELAIGGLLDYIEGFGVEFNVSRSEAIEVLSQSIKPNKSGTFRKGQPGNWKNNFTEDNKRRFKAVAGDLLTRLGYEDSDQDW
ncbi:MAG: sulfotransferase domain-containing protein [Chloroflexi bacterium]|nr:sulfotransferase domain-containing protein [Chloroflexota bacterium]